MNSAANPEVIEGFLFASKTHKFVLPVIYNSFGSFSLKP